MQSLTEFKSSFDPLFSTLLSQKIAEASEYTKNPAISDFLQHISRYVQGGKRFRPYAVYYSYTLAGGTKPHESLLCAIELLHVFALIHDDIMDKSLVRHNTPTAHVYAGSFYNNAHHGNSQAILLGDLAFAWATELFFKDIIAHPYEAQATADFSELIKEVIVGQMFDAHLAAILAPTYTTPTIASLDDITLKNRLKTAHYSFAWPFIIGNTVAGGSLQRRQALLDCGTAVGLAFQAQDDILDVTITNTGKAKCSDLEQGQQTILSAYIATHGTLEQKELLTSFQGKELSDIQKNEACAFMHSSGAVAYAQAYATECFAEAKKILLEQLPEEASVWLPLISEIEQRSK